MLHLANQSYLVSFFLRLLVILHCKLFYERCLGTGIHHVKVTAHPSFLSTGNPLPPTTHDQLLLVAVQAMCVGAAWPLLLVCCMAYSCAHVLRKYHRKAGEMVASVGEAIFRRGCTVLFLQESYRQRPVTGVHSSPWRTVSRVIFKRMSSRFSPTLWNTCAYDLA